MNFQSVALDYDLSVASRMNRPADGSFDWAPNNQGASQGKALPAELLPRQISFGGIGFSLAAAGKPNALVPHGQTITLPLGKYNRVYLLAAAANSDQAATFRIGGKSIDLMIQEWTGFVGQWDDRIWKTTEEQIPPRPGAPGRGRELSGAISRARIGAPLEFAGSAYAVAAGHPDADRLGLEARSARALDAV